jgi:hypothetical protein
LAYSRVVEFRWEPSGGVTLFIWVRGLPYQRKVGPRGLLTLNEAAVILDRDFSTLFRWVKARKLKVVQRPGVIMVPMTEVRRLRAVAGGASLEPA